MTIGVDGSSVHSSSQGQVWVMSSGGWFLTLGPENISVKLARVNTLINQRLLSANS